jgi:ribosomal protein S18 acetylase RimI-like enzyme
MELRRIRTDEGGRLRDIRLRALRQAPTAFSSSASEEDSQPRDEWDRAAARRASSNSEATYVAVHDGEWVGLVGAYVSDPDGRRVDLVSMWTVPEVRGRGIGRALVDAALAWAASVDAASVELWVTRGNDPAIRLYESMGFEATGDHQPLPSDPCKDQIRMRRPVR